MKFNDAVIECASEVLCGMRRVGGNGRKGSELSCEMLDVSRTVKKKFDDWPMSRVKDVSDLCTLIYLINDRCLLPLALLFLIVTSGHG